MKAFINPFPVSGYLEPAYFCDRQRELDSLLEAAESGRNVTLIALRRMGKTALIHHLFHHLKQRKNWTVIYADLMPTASLRDLAEKLVTALAQAAPETSPTGKKFWSWMRKIRPLISFDPYSGAPQVTLELSRIQDQELTLHQLFRLLEESGKRTIIALDEFQQITQYPEKQTEAWLRSEIQNLKWVEFIFCGSQQQILSQMFSHSRRPFYASAQTLSLSYIDKGSYQDFIAFHMKKNARKMDAKTIDYLLEWCRLHTYYVQILCNRLFASGQSLITVDSINSQVDMLFREQEAVYLTYRELLTSPQWSLLTGIAKENRVYQPTAMDFIRKHQLGTAATVRRSLKALLNKEMIFMQFEKDGRKYYQVYDVFLSRWLERNQ